MGEVAVPLEVSEEACDQESEIDMPSCGKDRPLARAVRHRHFYQVVRTEEEKLNNLDIIHTRLGLAMFVVFCNTEAKIKWLKAGLRSKGFYLVSTFYGTSLSDWHATLEAFHKGSAPVLITTDTWAEHFGNRQCRLVFNFDLPQDSAVGYSKRVGAVMNRGYMISFAQPDQVGAVADFVAGMEELPAEVMDMWASLDKIL